MTTTLPEKTETPIEVQILERAALIIEEHGHCCAALFATEEHNWDATTGWPVNHPQLSYCEVGAIWRAGFEHGLLPRYWDDLMVLAAKKWPDGTGDGYDIIAEAAGFTEPGAVDEIHKFNDRVCDAKMSAAHLRKLAREWQAKN